MLLMHRSKNNKIDLGDLFVFFQAIKHITNRGVTAKQRLHS